VLPLYDAHNHLQDDWLVPTRAAWIADLAGLGLQGAVVNGTSEADWTAVADLAAAHAWVRPSFGLHPWDAGNRSLLWQNALRAALDRAGPQAAVGEIGLDRWMLDRARPDLPRLVGLRRAPLAEQAEVCAWQLELAAAENRPATLHCLDAFGPLHDLLRQCRRPARGFLLHAYGGPAELVKPLADLGAYFSFNGAFLDVRHAAKQAVFRTIPADRLLVETDAPAMPLPADRETHRLPPGPGGERLNHPANLAAAYAGLATLRGVPTATLADQVAGNFARLFG